MLTSDSTIYGLFIQDTQRRLGKLLGLETVASMIRMSL